MRETRTSKYVNLRNDIENDKESEYYSDALKPYAKRINKFDDIEFSDTSNNHTPTRVRQPETEINMDESTNNEDFLSTYLDEVKEYNKKEGYTSFDDTKLDIYNQVKGINQTRPVKTKKFNYINADDVSNEEIDFDKTSEIPFNLSSSPNDISDEIAKMLGESSFDTDIDLGKYNKSKDNSLLEENNDVCEVKINNNINQYNFNKTDENSTMNTDQYEDMINNAYGSNKDSLLNETQKIIVDYDNKHDLKHTSISDKTNDMETQAYNNITKEIKNESLNLTDQFLLRSDDDFEKLRKSQKSRKKRNIDKKQINNDDNSNNKLDIVLNIIILLMIIAIAVILFLVLKQRNII